MIPVIYIAGPFRGPNAWVVEKNIRRAEQCAFDVASTGAAALCPHTNTRFFNGTFTDEYWLAATLELLRRCDAVYTVVGWERSEGARGEIALARQREMPVLYSTYDLHVFVREWLPKHGQAMRVNA